MRHAVVLGTALWLALAGAMAAEAQSSFAHRSDGRDTPPVAPTPDPIITWASPHDGGRVKVLFIAPAGAMRDAEELTRRLECAVERVALPSRDLTQEVKVVEAAPVDNPDAPAPAPSHAETELPTWPEALRKGLAQAADVIVLANVEVEGLPTDVQEALVARVRGGMGLLLANTLLNNGPIDTFLAELQPSDVQARLAAGAVASPVQGGKAAGEFLRTLTLDAARVALLDYPGDPPRTHALLPTPPDEAFLESAWREDAWSLVLRALCWAAGRRPAVGIAALRDVSPQGPVDEEIPPDLPQEFVQSMRDAVLNLPLRNVQLDLEGPAPHAMEATFQLRRVGETRVAYTTTARIAKGATGVGTQLLVNPGAFTVDCVLRGRKGVVDWWSMPLTMGGWPEAEQVRADKTFLLPNDTLALTARVRPVFGASRSGTVYARALDPASTLLCDASAEVDSNGGNVLLSLAFADLLAPVVVVEVYAFEGNARRHATMELASSGVQVLRFPVRQTRREPRFELVLDTPARDEFNVRALLEAWHGLGAGAIHGGGGPVAVVRAAALGLTLIPPVTTVAPETLGDRSKPSLADTAARGRDATRVKDEVARYWAGGGGAYSLGWPIFAANPSDPAANPDQSDAMLNGYRSWLQGQYGDITTLNTAWKSQWTGFDEIVPPSLAACREAESPAPWMAWRTFQDEVFAEALREARGWVHGLDQAGAVGAIALDDSDSRRGYDWAQLCSTLDFVVTPSAMALPERVRSLRTQAKWGGLLTPETLNTEAEGRALAWKALLEQLPGIWIPNAIPNALDPSATTMQGDGQLAPAWAALTAEALRLQRAAGAFVLASARARSGVALLESRPSRLAHEVVPGFDRAETPIAAWAALLRREGFDFTVVSTAQVLSGGLSPYAVLILPASVALPPDAAAAIARFAQDGGALVADVPPAWLDTLGDRHEAPLLDAWFGIQHEAAPTLAEDTLDGQTITLDTATRADKAKPLAFAGERPLHLTVDDASQRSLLLNHLLPSGAGPWDTQVREFLLARGAARAITLEDAPQQGNIARARFRYGQAEVLAMAASADAPDKFDVKVPLPESARAYNVLDDLPIDRPKKASVRLQSGTGTVLSLLPYEVTELAVEGPALVQQGKRFNFAAQVRVRKAEPGRHLLRVTLLGPGGQVLEGYTQWLAAEGGMANGFIPILQGQAPGFYTVQVLDVLSGARFSGDLKIVGVSEQ